MRWLFYAVNGWGLGHLVQTLALARQLRKRAPAEEILFLTSSEATDLIWREGFACAKPPSHQSYVRRLLDRETVEWLNQTLVLEAFAAYEPDVVVVDCFPAGLVDELIPALRLPCRRVLVCREKVKSVREGSYFRRHVRLYDRVLIPHRPGEIEPPVDDEVPVEWTGYLLLRSATEALGRAEARRRLGLPAEGFVVYVGFGGGGDKEYGRLLRWILGIARGFPDWTFACSQPPLLQGPAVEGGQANVVSFSYFPLAECWAAFDGAVSALGLNTTAELLHHGVPTIFLPREVKEDDHLARARRILDAGAGWAARPYDSAMLRHALKRLGEPEARAGIAARARALVPENGAERAAAFLLDWARAPARPAAATS